jgi:hypothetical protein
MRELSDTYGLALSMSLYSSKPVDQAQHFC